MQGERTRRRPDKPVVAGELLSFISFKERPISRLQPYSATHGSPDKAPGNALKFVRVECLGADMEIWSAISDRFSFVISYETPTGPGFHGQTGFVASWRALSGNVGAIRVGGSPFKTLEEAEQACNTVLQFLTNRKE